MHFCIYLLVHISPLWTVFLVSQNSLIHTEMATSSRHLPNDETFPTSTAPVGQRSTRRLPRNPPQQGARLKERYMPLQQSSPFQADLRTIQQTTDQMLTQLEDIEHRLSGSTPCQPAPEAVSSPWCI